MRRKCVSCAALIPRLFHKRAIHTTVVNGVSSKGLSLTVAAHKFKGMSVFQFPAFEDNYIFAIKPERLRSESVVLVDPGDGRLAEEALSVFAAEPTEIMLTHHHDDHIGGVNHLCSQWPSMRVTGLSEDAQRRIPGINQPISGLSEENVISEEEVSVGELKYRVMYTPGHTIGHIVYFEPRSNVAFVGDVLFAMGCGRLFEGTAEQMWRSLQLLRSQFNRDTAVFCAHEYSLNNAKFALSVDPENPALLKRAKKIEQKRRMNEWTVPFTFGEELDTNPFLNVHLGGAVRKTLGMDKESISDLEVFTELRKRKDTF